MQATLVFGRDIFPCGTTGAGHPAPTRAEERDAQT